ncbi:MAG TPA: NUDIX hydrolase [Candidatus Baltobacteraceae bacterium]|nr:NUDIX hydrolase [Candidatus Baltobacteraceae bacterium]
MPEPTAWVWEGSRELYRRGHVVVREDWLRLPSGLEAPYPVLQLGRTAAIVPLTHDGEIVLVRQYRHVTRAFCWEIPGGSIHPGESPEDAAQRELREEAGLRARRLQRLGGFWPNNAYLDEIIHVFLAEDLTDDPLPPDADEALTRCTFPFAEALAMAQDDRITCGLTKLAIFWVAVRGHAADPARPAGLRER